MSKSNWAADYSNNLELCVSIGKTWAVLKDGENQKGLYRKINSDNPKYKENPNAFSVIDNEIFENICDLPSLYFNGQEFEGGVILHAEFPNRKVYFIMGNSETTPKRIEGEDILMKIENDAIIFFSSKTNEEIAIYNAFTFREITYSPDGQIGLDL